MTWKWTPCKTYSYDQIDHSVEYDDEWVKIGNFNFRSSDFKEALKTYYETTKPVVDTICKIQRSLEADLYSRINGIYDYTMIDHTPEYEPVKPSLPLTWFFDTTMQGPWYGSSQ